MSHYQNIVFHLFSSLIYIGASFSCSNPGNRDLDRDVKPNILLIVADDLGYADAGCYGGDIETPHIDMLAKEGIRFSRFHTAPYCAPTRAMLLSGNDNHIAGMGAQGMAMEYFGYEGRLTDRVAIIPEILSQAGYHTYMAGKWHLGKDSLANPFRRGFEHSFVNVGAAGTHYNDQGIFRSVPVTVFTEDGEPAAWPEGKYSTDFFTDKLIEYIEKNRKDGKPFFAFAAYTSPHWPLQVDEKFRKKYEGFYDDGYEKLKEKRLESLKREGLIPKTAILPLNHESVIPWDSLSAFERKIEARKMELYAGMVENLDQNIGRLLNYLKEKGELDNTLIVFMSDNGAAAEDFYNDDNYGPFIREHFNNDYENMGKYNSFVSYGPQWAEAGSSPFRYFKSMVTEGGIVAPMIVSGPGIRDKNRINHGLVTVMDIAPTFYEAAGVNYPEDFRGKEIYPLKGESFLKVLTGSEKILHSDDYVFAMEHNQRTMLRKGPWKLVNNTPPLQRENFQLYNLDSDLAEMFDLRVQEPDKYSELLEEWDQFSDEIKMRIPDPGPDR